VTDKYFFTESQSIDSSGVSFTSREETSTVVGVRRLSATQRFQRNLRWLLEERKKAGDKSAYGTLADVCEKPQSWVSNMLHEGRATQPDLEDLENIADFFRVSVNELLRPANPKDLTGDEQRVLLAFRSVPEVVQTHFLALLEAASVSTNLLAGKRLRQLKNRRTTAGVYPSTDGSGQLPESASQLTALRAYLGKLSLDFAQLATADLATHQPTTGTDARQPKSG
jgi:transcriptional regulator with XRE-family HTH domain